MSMFSQMVGGYGGPENAIAKSSSSTAYTPRTFKETINDQIAFHKAKIADLEAVRDSMSPEVEKFVEAIQRLG